MSEYIKTYPYFNIWRKKLGESSTLDKDYSVFICVGHMRCIKSNYFCWISNNGNYIQQGTLMKFTEDPRDFTAHSVPCLIDGTVTETTWLLLFQLHTFPVLYLASLEMVGVYLLVWIKLDIKKWRYLNFQCQTQMFKIYSICQCFWILMLFEMVILFL